MCVYCSGPWSAGADAGGDNESSGMAIEIEVRVHSEGLVYS